MPDKSPQMSERSTKESRAEEQRRVDRFATALLDAWTTTGSDFGSDCSHWSVFSGIVNEEIALIESRFEHNRDLRRACLASVAACIARMLVQDAVQ
jgi:hypothetical protein